MRLFTLLFIVLFAKCNTDTKLMDSTIIHAMRLKPGEDLKLAIDSIVAIHGIKAGWIITAVGSLTQTNIRYANQPKGVQLKGHFEIVSLTGILSVNGSHLHTSISDSTGYTVGGHLLEGNIVYTTVEIVIGETKQLHFTREKDGTTPWEELQIKKNE